MADLRHHTETVTSIDGEERSSFTPPDRWRLDRVLGAGGQGEVWLAFDSQLNEQVAVKVLARSESSTAAARLKREVRVGRKLRHEHLVQIYELVDAGSSLAVVMEYLEGGNLSQRMSDGAVEIVEVERVAEGLLEGLACLHREGIVHRDVKPSNVLFNGSGVPKLADFGTLSSMAEAGELTATNLTVGTPAYMSPEQVRGEEPAPPSDLYSLGVTLYHMVAGKRPFEGRSEFDVARMQVTDEPPPIRRERPDCPRWLSRFIHRLLAKEPKNRWGDAGLALTAFRARRWRPTRRGLIRAVAAVAASLVVGVLGVAAIDQVGDLRPVVEGETLVIRNAFGRTLWQKAIEGLQPVSVALDLAPEKGLEVLAAVAHGQPGQRNLDLRLFSSKGSPLTDFRVTSDINRRRQFPGMSENLQLPTLKVLDLGGTLGKTAVWIATDISWYPGVMGLWSEGGLQGPAILMVNSGHFRSVEAFDFDGDGLKELVVAGVNNEMGFQAFAAVVDPVRFHSRSPEISSPEQISSSNSGLMGYALFGEENEPDIQVEPGRNQADAPIVRLGRQTLKFDADGAIDGLSLETTKTFWIDVVHSAARLQNQGDRWNSEVDDLGRRHATVWSRPSYRAGAAFIFAKALAQAGNPGRGARVLEEVRQSGVRMRRLSRRIGEMHLLAGARSEGRGALIDAINSIGQGFGPVDELLDLGLDDALIQNESSWGETSRILGTFHFDTYRRQLDVVFNFYGGRFSECGLDLRLGPGILHSAFVMGLWAEIEDGHSDLEILDRLRSLELRAECQPLATLALARAEVLSGRPGEACARADEALWQVRERSASSWPDAVYLPLARWAYGTVLDVEGDTDGARPHFLAASSQAPGTFFGKDAAVRLSH